MKICRLIVSLLFVPFALAANSQTYEIYKGDTINQKDTAGKRHGYWIFFNEQTKAITSEGEYENNRKQGLWKSYYGNGKPKAEITYTRGRKKGPAKTYYKSGQVAEEGFWDANKWTGSYIAYHPNGQIAYQWNYNKMGRRVGEQKYFFANGKVMIEGNWENGKIAGTLKEFHPDGSIRSERTFVDGKVDHSKTKVFEPKGEEIVAKKESQKVAELPQGNTTVQETQQLVSGYFTGEGYHKLYKDSLLSREGEFKGGKLFNGKKFFYDNNKKLIKTIIYEEGQAVKVEKAEQ